MPATPAANEQTLLNHFLPLRDPHERLALITEACAGPGIPEAQRMEADLVAGCVSRVWLRRSGAPEVLHLEWDAESPLVRGLVGLMCQVYQDTDPATATTYRSNLLSSLGLDRQLSPTRLRGLAAMELRIQQLASL
jgi:cysteine desulfuration protein SufE